MGRAGLTAQPMLQFAAEREIFTFCMQQKNKRGRQQGGERQGGGSYLTRRSFQTGAVDGGAAGDRRVVEAAFSSFFFSPVSFFLLRSPFSLLFFLLLSLSLGQSLPLGLFFIFLVLPCFYRQKTGETLWWGGHCWPPPPLPFQWITTPGKWVSLVGVFLRKKQERKQVKSGEEKNLLLPCSLRAQGRRRWCRSKRHRFAFLRFLFLYIYNKQCMKRSHFGQNAPFHFKGIFIFLNILNHFLSIFRRSGIFSLLYFL